MKYDVKCSACENTYTIEADFVPMHCMKCGSPVEASPAKTRARIRAEISMYNLRTIIPKVEDARREWISCLAEYEDEMQLLRQYKKRGVVSEEELQKFAYKKTSERDALRELRARKNNTLAE